jgi:transcription elongation factor GreB
MSKAFTRESDDAPDAAPIVRPVSSLPPGARNYITADGERRMREELDRFIREERPRLASASGDADAKQRLQTLDGRIRQLQQILQTVEIVPASSSSDGQARFGAVVTVRRSNGEEEQYRIVGIDETDIDRGWVSWLSPIAKALLNRKTGETVRFRFPSGQEQLQIVSVTYDVPEGG